VTARTYSAARNVLVCLGLWWCFTFLGSIVVMVWNGIFVTNRIFHGEAGNLLSMALSLPAYILTGVLVGLGVARFVESPRVLAWAGILGLLVAFGDFGSRGGIQYLGRSTREGAIAAFVIVTSIVFGCWLGIRRRDRRTEEGRSEAT
jgi:hypothetical protein